MPKRIVTLSDKQIEKAKPTVADYLLNDGDGLSLIVKPNGSKLWKFNYYFNGKRKYLYFGTYPELSLLQAREKRRVARESVANDVDPCTTKNKESTTKIVGLNSKSTTTSFEFIAREWHKKYEHTWVPKHAQVQLQRLESNIFPHVGAKDINEIRVPELLAALHQIEERGACDLAHRVQGTCRSVYNYAIATGRCERNIAADLRGALPPAKSTHFAAITDPKELGKLLRAIDLYSGANFVKAAMQLMPMLFTRPGELRQMEWVELDFDQATWNIPGPKMKLKKPHMVPLPVQAIKIIEQLKPFTGQGKYVFSSLRSSDRPMSDNTINMALRSMGYDKSTVVAHGFRATARTMLDEILGFRVDIIEHQLAHAVKDALGNAYNRTTHLDARKTMMQRWADYLDEIRLLQ